MLPRDIRPGFSKFQATGRSKVGQSLWSWIIPGHPYSFSYFFRSSRLNPNTFTFSEDQGFARDSPIYRSGKRCGQTRQGVYAKHYSTFKTHPPQTPQNILEPSLLEPDQDGLAPMGTLEPKVVAAKLIRKAAGVLGQGLEHAISIRWLGTKIAESKEQRAKRFD